MKLGKTKLLILPLLLTSLVIPFTSCSTVHPYTNLSPGDKIEGLNKKNASYLKANVINQCDQYQNPTVDNDGIVAVISEYGGSYGPVDPNGNIKASTLMYWELAWAMSKSESGELSLVHSTPDTPWTTDFPSIHLANYFVFSLSSDIVIKIGNVSLSSDTPYYVIDWRVLPGSHVVSCHIIDDSLFPNDTTIASWDSRFFNNVYATE